MLFDSEECAEGWRYVKTTHQCITLRATYTGQGLSWSEADIQCKDIGGNLASLPDKNKHDAAVALAR